MFILADDLAWADVGYNGADFYETPNIDRMAAEGMRFNRFYPGGPNCAPSRACLMTGMYTPRHHLYQPGGISKGDVSRMRWKVPTLGQDASFQTFDSNRDWIEQRWTSVAEVLHAAGYATCRLGKWHLGEDDQGFELSTNDGVHAFGPDNSSRFYDDENVAERLTNRAIEFIEQNKDEPFFVYLSHWEVHLPLKAKRPLVEKYRDKLAQNIGYVADLKPIYAAEVEVVDHSVGRVRDKLSELGLADNTVVIFASDNGGVPVITSNLPLRGGKGSLFEGGIRTPLTIVWPNHIEANTASDVPVAGVDLLPTLADLADAPLPTEQPVDGVSIAPLFRGEPLEERGVFLHYPLYLSGRANGKVLPAFDSKQLYWRAVPASAVIWGDWKLIHYYEYGSYRLFNLKDDISEKVDLSVSNSDKTNELSEVLMQWVSQTEAPVPNILNPLFVNPHK